MLEYLLARRPADLIRKRLAVVFRCNATRLWVVTTGLFRIQIPLRYGQQQSLLLPAGLADVMVASNLGSDVRRYIPAKKTSL